MTARKHSSARSFLRHCSLGEDGTEGVDGLTGVSLSHTGLEPPMSPVDHPEDRPGHQDDRHVGTKHPLVDAFLKNIGNDGLQSLRLARHVPSPCCVVEA